MNRKWTREEFAKIRYLITDAQSKYENIDDRVEAISYVLEEAQQVPLRASQEQGWFSSLIVSGQNHQWWETIKTTLSYTRRKSSLSLVTQMLVAIIAWILTILAQFIAGLGDPVVQLQISAGSIWIWMIPVIWGWLLVGTQARRDSIKAALEANPASRAITPPTPRLPQENQPAHAANGQALQAAQQANPGAANERLTTNSTLQRGLIVLDDGSGLCPNPLRTTQNQRHRDELSERPSRFWDIRGDERESGPIFNYARIFTYRHLIATVLAATTSKLENMKDNRTVAGRSAWVAAQRHEHYVAQLEGTAAQVADYCGLEGRPLRAYPRWRELHMVWRDMAIAAVGALFVQWGTTGAAIMIAYLTPVVGLGCRSGSYLLYGTTATVAWLLLMLSTVLSHAAMLRFQHAVQGPAPALAAAGADGAAAGHPLRPMDSAKTLGLPEGDGEGRRRVGVGTGLLRAAAVLTRVLGKTLVVLNALWVVVISLFEYTGGFSNCWCEANTPGMGDHGWVVLFKTAHDLAQAASKPTGLGVALSVFVCLVSLAGFKLGSG